MTYKAQLEQLLAISIQKSNAFLAVAAIADQAGTAAYAAAQAEWEAAEKDYAAFLDLIKSNQVNVNSTISANYLPPVMAPAPCLE